MNTHPNPCGMMSGRLEDSFSERFAAALTLPSMCRALVVMAWTLTRLSNSARVYQRSWVATELRYVARRAVHHDSRARPPFVRLHVVVRLQGHHVIALSGQQDVPRGMSVAAIPVAALLWQHQICTSTRNSGLARLDQGGRPQIYASC